MAEKRIFSRLNRWWRNPEQQGADDPSTLGGDPGGEPGPASDHEEGSESNSSRNPYPSDVLPPEVEAAGQEALEAEVENLTRKLETKQKHLEGLLEQRNELHHQLRSAQETIAGLEARLKEDRSQSEAATSSQLESFEDARRHLVAERDAALNRLQELEAKLSQDMSAQETALRERDARIAALESDLTLRSQALEGALRAKAELNQRSSTFEQDLERARASQEELKKAHEETQRALTLALEADEARKRAEDRTISLQSEVSALQAQLNQHQAELESLRQQAAVAPPTQPPTTPAQPQSFDLTSELAEAAAALPSVSEPPPAASQPPIVTPSLPEGSSEPTVIKFDSPPDEAATKPAASPIVPDLPERMKKLILIAEDDASIRRLVELALQKAGHEVITAEDGEEAYQKAITERPDAILTDMMMPNMDGLELTSKLKKTALTARIPVGFLTAQRELEYYKGALDLGSTLYITKPFRPDNLVTLVNVLLSGKKKPRGGHKK